MSNPLESFVEEGAWGRGSFKIFWHTTGKIYYYETHVNGICESRETETSRDRARFKAQARLSDDRAGMTLKEVVDLFNNVIKLDPKFADVLKTPLTRDLSTVAELRRRGLSSYEGHQSPSVLDLLSRIFSQPHHTPIEYKIQSGNLVGLNVRSSERKV